MKKVFAFMLGSLMVMATISCGNKTTSQEEADSLLTALENTQNDYNQLKEFLSVVATGLDSISIQESDIFKTSAESPVPDQQRIKQQLAELKTSLQNQRTKISELEKKLKTNSKDAAMMQTVINMLKGQLEEKSNRIVELQAELDSKKLTIEELNSRVNSLTSQTARQQETINAQGDMLTAQDEMLNMGYVKIGTKSELKDAGLLSGGFLKKTKVDVSGIDKSLFKTVDVRKMTEMTIPSKSAKIMTQMPEESYIMETNGNNTTLRIIDPGKFWSISKFLIIQTN